MGRKALRPANERYDELVDSSAGPEGCWWWRGKRYPNLTPVFYAGLGRVTTAARFAWDRAHPGIGAGGNVKHSCVHRDCMNPAHLVIDLAVEKPQRDERPAVDILFASVEIARHNENCWVWIGATNRGAPVFDPGTGYSTNVAAFMWELASGEPVKQGARIFRDCGNIECVSPFHLKSGGKYLRISEAGMLVLREHGYGAAPEPKTVSDILGQ